MTAEAVRQLGKVLRIVKESGSSAGTHARIPQGVMCSADAWLRLTVWSCRRYRSYARSNFTMSSPRTDVNSDCVIVEMPTRAIVSAFAVELAVLLFVRTKRFIRLLRVRQGARVHLKQTKKGVISRQIKEKKTQH